MKVLLVEIRNIGKSGRVKIRTETFRNYFGLEAAADKVNMTTEPSFSKSKNG